MSPELPITRSLNAILYADIVGYSRLMGEDEAGTHTAVQAEMARAQETVKKHGGRIANTAGDAFLAVFPSINSALMAAIDFQSTTNRKTPDRIAFRIGLNIGDAIETDGDVFGEGVNIAARVQELADPGGIAVTGSVRFQVSPDLNARFHDLGERDLKNISEPVHVFAVIPDGDHKRFPSRRPRRAILVGALVLGVIGAFVTGLTLIDRFLPTTPAITSAKPTVAVLPFRDRSIPPNEGYFSEGVTEDVISLLGRFPELFVLSWNAVAGLDSNVEVSEASALGADYVVSGSLQRNDAQLRASVQLSDAKSGHLLWSERYDQPIADIFVVQDEISRAVVEALAVRIDRQERERAQVANPNRLSAYEMVLRGRSLLHVPTRENNLHARRLFEDALALDPDYAAAHVNVGWTHRADFLWGWSHNPSRSFSSAERHARAAVAAEPENASAHALLADVARFQGEMEEARSAIEVALELNPSAALAQAIHGSMLLYEGQAAASIPPLQTARRLDPALPSWTTASLAQAFYQEGRYQDAINVISDVTTNMGEDPSGYAIQAAAEAQLGNLEAARLAAGKVRRIYPFFDAQVYVTNVAPADDAGHLLDGLRKAGFK